MKGIFLTIFLFNFFLISIAAAQGFKEIVIDESQNGKPLTELFSELELKYNVSFIYNEKILEGLTVFGVGRKYKVDDFLNVFLPSHRAVKLSNYEMIILDIKLWDKYGHITANYFTFKSTQDSKQVIKGEVIDANSLEAIIGAEIYIPELKTGGITDINGKFEIYVPKRIYEMEIRYTGYESETKLIGFSQVGKESLDAYLYSSSTQLENVTITAESQDRNVTSIVTGVEKLGIETIKALPTFMGEVDPIRSLTTLPGVSTVGELSAGFNVRGGETGQNLILQDEAIIYNPTHLFGFFSAFNPDMVQDVELFKGGGPAKYGGRASSVLDIKLKNGESGNHRISGGIGLVSSRLAIEGPIKKNKTSYLLGGRISYSNWLINSLNDIQLKNSSANFYDLTAKIFHQANSNDFLTATAYYSFDDFNFGSDSTFSWATTNVSVAWDHTFNENTVSRLSLANSNYYSKVLNDQEIGAFQYRNSINNLKLKYGINLNKGENSYNFGIEGNGSLLDPGELKPKKEDGVVLPTNINNQNALEFALFSHGEFKLSDSWALSAGIRYSMFYRLGEDAIYSFDYDNLDGRYPSIVDTTFYSNGEIISTYGGFEPRVSFRYLINENSSLKASYYRNIQYLHLISYTTSPTPQDYWIASGPYISPEIGNQFSLGYFKNLKNNMFEFSLEAYYKLTDNTIDYIEGADILLNESLEAGLAQGEGLAYGIEFQLKKNTGKLFGWISYTYSRSLRKFNSLEGSIESINNGDYYPSIHDQPNNLSLVLNYKTGKRSTLSTNFSYSTGRPITIPISKFSYDAFLSVLNYSERNEYRIPDYHRLDISWSIKDKPVKNKRFIGEWIFSVYNVYGRKNAYAIYFNQYGRAKKLSILGSVFPSISYNFKF
ncbi:MAG: TonB-dependent receptor [Cyclobacteriaceae bacterium]|nr:TonB-dependent receptor [Cyclobacteriaceae bacterium]